VISLGADLGFEVLAEGVETEAQFERLLHMGCEQMQGYLLTPPVAADRAATLLEQPWGTRQVTARAQLGNSGVSTRAN